MAVLVEGISIIVRRDAIDAKFTGGWAQFLDAVPNLTMCTDGDLVRVGFMAPSDVEVFATMLEAGGLTFLDDEGACDFAIADQVHGLTTEVRWLEFARLAINSQGDRVGACWLYEGERIGHGIHMPALKMELATPDGWVYENSLSAKFTFIPNDISES